MARVTPEELLARIEKGQPIAALLLLGEEPYLRDACRKQLIEKYVPEASRTWAVSRYSAEHGDTQAALEQAQTLPMLARQQVVFLEDAESIEKFGEKNRDAAVEQLEGYLSNPAPFTVLAIEATALDQRMKLAKLLMEKTLVVEVGLGDRPEERLGTAVGFARAIAKEDGVEFEKGAAEDLAEYVSADLMRLKTEIEKLVTYAGERKRIRREDVATMVISEKTTTVWDLAELLVSRQQNKAMEFLNRLLNAGEAPLEMLGAMTWMYRKLMEASELKGMANGYQAAGVLKMRPEQAEIAVRSARKISKGQLLEGLNALQKADDRLKSGGKDPRTAMEFLVAELTGAEKRKVGAGGSRD
jgi:DNA polymerase-3 subunit delta